VLLCGSGTGACASITHDDDTKPYGRHLTVVQGAMVVSGGLIEPRVYDAAQSGR
jgi:hypothetical protein